MSNAKPSGYRNDVLEGVGEFGPRNAGLHRTYILLGGSQRLPATPAVAESNVIPRLSVGIAKSRLRSAVRGSNVDDARW